MNKGNKNLAQQTADKIYNMIVKHHDFNLGDKLPNENDFSMSLGISRVTLRAAIKILSLQGILDVKRGKGTFVTSNKKVFDDFGLGDLTRTKTRLKDLYEMRLMFEPQVAYLASIRATEDEIKCICEKGEIVAQNIMAGKDRTLSDQEFHKAIVDASHNEFMVHLIPMINRAVSDSIFMASNCISLAEDTLSDHKLLIDFIKKRDAAGARNAMEIHIRHAMQQLNLSNIENL